MDLTKNDELIGLINSKIKLNKDVTDATFVVFSKIKKVLSLLEKLLKDNLTDERIKIRYYDTSTFETKIVVGDDVLIFIMHTNALIFDPSHPIHKTGYIQSDSSRSTCGMISVYNFLSDSFKFERRKDIGQLIARIFINRENHFFIEGKKQMGVLFNDFPNQTVDEKNLLSFIENAIEYCLQIDPYIPAFELMKEISVDMVIEHSLQASISSGKRLGFKFEKDSPDEEFH